MEHSEGVSPILLVNEGTQKATVEAWRVDKLVPSIQCYKNMICGATVGSGVRITILDYKVCVLLLTGKGQCTYTYHRDVSTLRGLHLKQWEPKAVISCRSCDNR